MLLLQDPLGGFKSFLPINLTMFWIFDDLKSWICDFFELYKRGALQIWFFERCEYVLKENKDSLLSNRLC